MVHVDVECCEKLNQQKAIVVGSWGGNGGNAWDDGCYNGVREITLKYGRCVDSISIIYDKNCKPVAGGRHGGAGGGKTAEIKLIYPDEYLTAVSGYYNQYPDKSTRKVIRSLSFKSNLRTFGPFGEEQGTPFTFSMEGGKIVGFKGKSGVYLDSLGFHLTKEI